MKALFKEINNFKTRTGVTSANNLVIKLSKKKNPFFKGNNHQDTHEFLVWLLNELDDQYNKLYKIKTKLEPNTPILPLNWIQ